MRSSLKFFVRIFTSVILFFSFYSALAQTVTVPAANINNGSVNDPFGTYWGFERSAMIYSSAQIGTTGNINSVGFYVNSVATPGNAVNVRIYMKMRTTTFGANTTYATETTGATLVYGPTNIASTSFVGNTWVTVPLATNFNYTGGTNNLEVIIETNATGAGNEGFTSKQFRYSTQGNNQWYQNWNADNTAPTGNGTRSTNRPNIQLNFVVSTACSGTPTGGTSSSATSAACSGVNFTVSNTGQTAGTGITYVWQSGPSNTGPWTNIGTASATYTALTANQTAAKYYRLLTTCTNSSTSTGSTPVLVGLGGTCQCLGYCNSNFTDVTYEFITNVNFSGINNTSGGTAGGPVNYTSVASASVQQGQSYNLSVTIDPDGGDYIYAWFDWNQNGSFADAGEQYTVVNATAAAGPHVLSIPVPVSATLGTTRMRVMVDWNNPTPNPCRNAFYGEAEDYCVTITGASPCAGTPTGGTSSSSVGSACSGVNFTLSNSGQTGGTGLIYQWQSGPSATGPWANLGTSTTSYATATTNQSVATYYRLLTTCTSGSASTDSAPILVNMGGNCTCLPYTIIVPTYTADEDIGNVTVGTLNNSSTCAQTGTGPGSSLNLFSNYAGSGVTVPNLQQGSSTSFSLTSITCGGNYGNGFQIYIDWNQNGNFNDVGERMYSMATAVTGPHTETGTFTVPLTATLGSTRMRVVCVEATFPDATNYASTGYLWGETEDYCVNIIAAPPCTGAPTSTAAASPSTICAENTSTLSLTGLSGTGLSYQWQSGTSATGPWSNIALATGGTYTTPTLSSTFYYRCNVTCSGSGITSPSSAVTITVTPAPAGATLSNPIFAGVLDCNPYSNTLSNAPGACIGNDLAAGTNQASEDIFYFFNLSNANNFNAIVNMSHCGSGFDTYMHLLTSAGGLIVENDDAGPLCGGTASSIQATLAPGFYYLVSEGFAANSGNINTQIQIAPITGAGSIAGLTTVCLPSTNTYTVSGLTNITGAIWTVPAGATIVSGQGTTSISVSFPSGAAGGNITCVPYNGPCSSATLTLAIATSTPVGDPSVSPTGQWNVYSYNAGDATGGSGAWTNNYAGYYSISNLSFDTQTGQANSTPQSWVNSVSPSSAAGYQGCSVQIDNHSYIFKRTGVPTCGTYRIDALNHDDMAILYVNGAEVWRHNGCCDVHIGVWTGYLDASSVLEYRISEGGGGSNAGLAFTQIATTATLTGTNPPSCLVNGTITISNVTGGACNLLSTGFGSLPSSTAVS